MADAKLELVIGVVDKATSPLGKIAGGLSKVGTVAAGVATGGLALAAGGVAALGAALVGGIGDAREAAIIMAQTEAVIKSTGGAAGVTAEQVGDLAASLSAASGASLFGDDQIQESTNLLLTFTNIKGAALDAATAISVDMAQALGGAPADAAVQLGKALNDPINGITALSRVGVSFSEEQKAMIATMVETGDVAGAQAVIIAELNKEFGGSAAAAAAADGGMAMFKDRMGELAESIGAQLLPHLNMLMAWLNSPEVQAGIEAIVNGMVNGMGAAFTWIGTVALPALMTAFQTVWPLIQAAVNTVYVFLSTVVWPWLQNTAFPWLQNVALPALQAAFQTVWPMIQQAVSTVYTFLKDVVWAWLQSTAFPWLTGTALPALQAAFEVAWPLIQQAVNAVYTFFKDVVWPWIETAFRNTVEKEIPAIKNAFQTAWPIIQKAVSDVYTYLSGTVWPWLQTATTNIVSWINTAQAGWSSAWSLISSAVTGAKNTISGAIETIKSLIQGAIDKINALIRAINSIPGVNIPSIPTAPATGGGGSGFGGPNMRSVGERAPLGGFSGNGSGGFIVNVDARNATDPRAVGQNVERGLRQAGIRADIRLRTT
jgi:phage-related protein